MFADFIVSFLGTIGGMGVAIAILRRLSLSFLEHRLAKALSDHKHTLDQQLSRLSADLNRVSDVLSRRNEREFGVTEGAWERMIRAAGTAQEQLGDGRRIPVFAAMNDEDSLRVINELPFDEAQKQQLREADPQTRDALYAQFDFGRGVRESYREWAEFKNFVSTRQIFFHSSILQGFMQIRDDLHGVLVRCRLYVNRLDEMSFNDTADLRRTLAVDLNNKIDQLAVLIRRRFGFDDAATDAPTTQ